MHEVGSSTDLDVAAHGRGGERIEEPVRIRVGAIIVPLTADDGDRQPEERRIVRELPGPGGKNVLKRTARYLNGCRRSPAAVGVAGKIPLAPGRKLPARQHRRCLGRDCLGEALPLVGQGDQAPARQMHGAHRLRAPGDGTEKYQTVEEIWRKSRQPARDHASPGMRNDGEALPVTAAGNETHRGLELRVGIDHASEGLAQLGRAQHLGIGVRAAEAMKIQGPDVEAGSAERVSPGAPVEAIGDGEGGGEGGTMHIKHGGLASGELGRKPPQGPGGTLVQAGYAVMLLIRIELDLCGRGLDGNIHDAAPSRLRLPHGGCRCPCQRPAFRRIPKHLPCPVGLAWPRRRQLGHRAGAWRAAAGANAPMRLGIAWNYGISTSLRRDMQERAILRPAASTADQRWMVLIGAVFVLCWASGFVVPRVFAPYAEPLTFVAWRNAGAVLVLAGLSLGLGASWPRTAAEVAGLLWAGACLQGFAVMGLYWAVYWGLPVGIAALVGGLQPALTAFVRRRAAG